MLEPTSRACNGQGDPSVDGDETVQCRGLTKRYGSFTALDNVDLTLRKGEFVALLGPNGAGKSTLIKILDGVLQPDQGEVRFGGGAFPVSAGVIHQDLGLFDDLSVAENLFLGNKASKHFISIAGEHRTAVDLLAFVGLGEIDPRTLLRDLSLGERALVATARLWSQGAGVIVVDEVTASLPRVEALWLMKHLKQAAASGATVMMVTHRMGEVLGNVDRYVVLVDGRIALDADAREVDQDRLNSVMSSSRNRVVTARRDVQNRAPGEVVVEVDNASVGGLGPISLQLRSGEVTGLCGSSASGFHDAAYLAAGVARPKSGAVKVRRGTTVRCLPADRDVDGTFPDQTVEFNMAIGNLNRWRQCGLISVGRLRSELQSTSAELNVVPRNIDAVITTLSGGNQQKALLGRVVVDEPTCVVLCEPTRGVDVSTRREIYSFIKKLKDDDCAVLVASSDMEDLASVADRIAFIGDDGRVETWVESAGVAEFCTARATEQA